MAKNVFIISIGDELLNGSILNTNAQYISSIVNRYNYEILGHISVRDREEDIIQSIKYAEKKSDIILITGGLGPTPDDITLSVIAKYMKKKLILDKKIYKIYKNKINIDNENIIRKQAMKIESCRLLDNKAGIAFGEYIEFKNKKYFIMPGVPKEVNSIMKYIENHFFYKKNKKISKFRLSGILENEILSELQKHISSELIKRIAFLPSYKHVDIVLYHNKFNDTEIKYLKKIIKKLFAEFILPKNKDLIDIIHEYFIKNKLSLSIAESCTGGLLSKTITDKSGSSKYFKGGIIAYSNSTKINLLKINKKIINNYGAVSEQTAYVMAENTRKKLKADYGIAITGIAGPKGGTKNKPVGLVYIAISGNKKTIVKKCFFPGNRDTIRNLTIYYSLYYLYRSL